MLNYINVLIFILKERPYFVDCLIIDLLHI